MDIKLITIQVAHSDNRTLGYGYDASSYESEDKLFSNMTAEFSKGFPATTEYASLTCKFNDGNVKMILLNTDLKGEDLVSYIKEAIAN